MSPINFDNLLSDYPDYGEVWVVLKRWFVQNRKKRFVETAILASSVSGVTPLDLVNALLLMQQSHMVHVSLRVKSPDGVLLDGDFDTIQDVPEELPDRFGSHKVRTGEGDVVTGVKWDTVHGA